jgi:molybdate transport system substrate-binding protein
MINKIVCAVVLSAVSLLQSAHSYGEETLVAVATNFIATARQLKPVFESETGHRLILSSGSTGKLYTQIAYGAPYDVLLAADVARPARAEAEGLAVAGSRFTYAIGKLVLCGLDAGLLVSGADVLETPERFNKLAIANPDTAPYGAAAVEVMRSLGVYDGLKHRLVQGENIAQTYQFVASGNASLGFVALSQLSGQSELATWRVPEDRYAPILQAAVLLRRGAGNSAAQSFMAFLASDRARAIIAADGYGVE